MLVRIRLFAQLRERAGASELSLDLPEGACVRDALADAAVASLAEGMPLVMAVNREYAGEDVPLASGDELALIPPVSGGATAGPPAGAAPAPHVAIVDGPLSLDALVARVRDPRAGAVVTFAGVTREVPSLEYEAYAEMAVEQMRALVADAVERHGLCAAAAEHRVGVVPLSEASVVVAVSAPHRAEAFAGGREIIDRLKALAPIWKRERDEAGGTAWVHGTTPRPHDVQA
ncbi:MAG TPA: molybdenum cofactor biosynthesis protein MoaE [Conexibacter sp.]|nr:molybdenum cofactor biosynthesis protein MoaE [Conexibacter sp.]